MADSVEVKAKLTVETDGEPAAFEETAKAVERLGESSGSSSNPVAKLSDELATLASKAGELGPVAQGAIREFSAAMKEASSSSTVDAEVAALTRARDAWQKFGDEAKKSGDLPKKSLEELDRTLDQLNSHLRSIADPLATSASKAEKSMKDLSASIDDGFKGAPKKIGDAKAAIDDYKKSLDAAKKAGSAVTSDQLAQLQRLEAEYRRASGELGKFKASQAEARKETKDISDEITGEAGAVGDLSELLGRASPKWGVFIGRATGVVGAFLAGYEAGEKLREILNDLTDGAFDEFVQKGELMRAAVSFIDDAVGHLAGTARGASTDLETLANQRHLFDKLGFKGFSDDVEVNAKRLDDWAKKLHIARGALEAFAKSLGLSQTELKKSSDELVQNIKAFEAANSQLGKKEFATIFKKQIQEILDAYEKLHIQAPAALLDVAKSLDIFSSKHEEVAQRVRASALSIIESITGISAKTTAQLREDAASLIVALSNIKVSGLDLGQFEKAQAEIRKVIAEFQQAGVAIPPELAKIAAKFVVYADGANAMNEAIRRGAVLQRDGALSLHELTAAQDEAAAAAGRLSAGEIEVGKNGEVSSRQVTGHTLSVAELLAAYGQASVGGREAAKTAREHGDAHEQSTPKVKAAGDAVKETGDKASEASSGIDKAGQGMKSTGAAADGLKAAAGGIDFSHATQQLDHLVTALDSTNQLLGKIEVGVERLAKLGDFAAPIVQGLEQIIEKGGLAERAILALVGAV
jgi:hypothetical protein